MGTANLNEPTGSPRRNVRPVRRREHRPNLQQVHPRMCGRQRNVRFSQKKHRTVTKKRHSTTHTNHDHEPSDSSISTTWGARLEGTVQPTDDRRQTDRRKTTDGGVWHNTVWVDGVVCVGTHLTLDMVRIQHQLGVHSWWLQYRKARQRAAARRQERTRTRTHAHRHISYPPLRTEYLLNLSVNEAVLFLVQKLRISV